LISKKNILSFISLYTNNAVNYLLPLVIIPYIIKIVGIESYGYLVFGLALSSYFKVLIDFGFDITITKQIIKSNFEPEKISEIFSIVVISKVILLAISLLIFSVILPFLPITSKIGYVFFYLNFIFVFSSVLNVNAYFYASHNIKYITITNAISKALYLLSLVLFLKSNNQIQLLALLSSMSWILPNLILFIISIYKFKIRFKIVDFKKNIDLIYESKNAFISELAVSFYGTTNLFIMGLFFPGTITGIYGAIEKVYNAFTNIISSANYVLYPILLNSYEKHKNRFKEILYNTEIKYFLVTIICSVIMYIVKEKVLIYLIGDTNNIVANNYYTIFVFALIFSPFGAFYTRIFLILNYSKKLIKVTFTAFIINIVILFPLLIFDLYFYIPVSVLVTQIYISVTKRKIVNSNL
jgi:PST family polysaccharide transporter